MGSVLKRALVLSAIVAGLAPCARAQDPPSVVPMGTQSSELLLSKITVTNLARSFEFYTKVIGLKHAAARPGQAPPDLSGSADFTEVPLNFTGSLADPFFVLVKRKGVAPTREGAALAQIGFKVPDVRAMIARYKAAGYKVDREPRDGPGNVYVTVQDPDGYNVEFIQAPSMTRGAVVATSSQDKRPTVTGKNLIYSVGLNVEDMNRALKFFTEGLGMKERSRFAPSPGTLEVWVGYGNDRESEIMLVSSNARTRPVDVGDWGRMVLYVTDVRAIADSVVKVGVGKIVRPPSAQPANKVTTLNLEDPDGHRLELVEFN
jgi:catechol 2,3-dioxygenase-like lactoylglutathione lyase family enzyme